METRGHKYIAGMLLFACFILPGPAKAMDCGSLENSYGPFDYRNPESRQKNLPLVETAHFNTVTYTSALGGLSNREYTERYNATNNKNKFKATPLGNDIDYTLRAFPNHHKALYAMMEYQRLTGKPKTRKYRTAECYLVRAQQFAPDDGTVLLLYGIYFHKSQKFEETLVKYKEAERMTPSAPELMYNIGLLYFDLEDYENANIYASKAYSHGYPLQGLKNKLSKVTSD